MKKMNVFVFLTKVGVGYGLVALEATISGLPAVSYGAKGDVLSLFNESNFTSINDLSKKLNNETKFKILKLPPYLNQEIIEKRTMSYLGGLIY